MASSPSAPAGRGPAGPAESSNHPHQPNPAFRRLRGQLSPREFAASVRRAAREIGEQVSCDARYIGRVEAGEIRCPNYAYERVFLHMFPGCTLTDLGFTQRDAVRGRAARRTRTTVREAAGDRPAPCASDHSPGGRAGCGGPEHNCQSTTQSYEESDVLRRAFMTGGPAALATAPLWGPAQAAEARPGPTDGTTLPRPRAAEGTLGRDDVLSVEEAVRRIRLLDDRHGADNLYRRADLALRQTFELLDSGARAHAHTERLHSHTGELALSVGWLAHDSERYQEARSHYGEALALARVGSDPGLEAHAFCNTAFLARDAGRPREALRAAQAGQQAAGRLGSSRLQALLALREAGGWGGLGDRAGCEEALSRARTLFDKGPSDSDPEWMSFLCDAELSGLESQCWSALGDWERAAELAREAVALQPAQFVRNRALFTAELAGNLAVGGDPVEAATEGNSALTLLETVRSARVRRMLHATAERLTPHTRHVEVAGFLARLSA
ncbi:hypothetical protein JGS22_014430 [Streptomyces sp. P38-E01]|uniref:C1 regulatory protein n=1 Tax=Streptomyces tardus TaxID=2780544 RepID=A0A949N5B4_9ACTN|nr:hypothetical protein [Streptomyces tardus]MBU7598774.1 hypothetical protein [Streptomyces tardus]